MKRLTTVTILSAFAALALGVGTAAADRGPRRGPPPARPEAMNQRAGFLWVEGHWVAQGRGWSWMPGHYERARAGDRGTAGGWDPRDGGRLGPWSRQDRGSVDVHDRRTDGAYGDRRDPRDDRRDPRDDRAYGDRRDPRDDRAYGDRRDPRDDRRDQRDDRDDRDDRPDQRDPRDPRDGVRRQ